MIKQLTSGRAVMLKAYVVVLSLIVFFSCHSLSLSKKNEQKAKETNENIIKESSFVSKEPLEKKASSVPSEKNEKLKIVSDTSENNENSDTKSDNEKEEKQDDDIQKEEESYKWLKAGKKVEDDLKLYHKIKWFIQKEKYDHALKVIGKIHPDDPSFVMTEPLYLTYLQRKYILLKIKKFKEYDKAFEEIKKINEQFKNETDKYLPLIEWNHGVYLRRNNKITEDEFIQIIKNSVFKMRKNYWQGSYLYLHMQRKLVYRYYIDKLPAYQVEKKSMHRRFWLLGINYTSFSRKNSNKMTYLLPVFLTKDRLGLTLLEKKRITHFTEMYKYNYERHSNDVRARTFPNRQKDSNIFVSSLKDGKDRGAFWDDLKKEYQKENRSNLFIDIGPGLANRFFSCVSTIELANENPYLKIIALDLPSQVERFYKVVPNRIKQKVYKHKNIIIIGADGTKPLKNQIENYPTKKRRGEPENPEDALTDTWGLFIRAANSIDVYYHWNVLEELIFSIKQDFPDRPVVIFMNRLILYKSAENENFRYIGQLSPWGFNHWTSELSRKGETPFTLFLDL